MNSVRAEAASAGYTFVDTLRYTESGWGALYILHSRLTVAVRDI